MANWLERKRMANALQAPSPWQGMADNAPVGSVGAPGGLLAPPTQTPINYLKGLLSAASFAPGIGDAAGLAADAQMYLTDPKSRTKGNFALTGLGLLPFVPAAATVFHGSPHKFDAFDMSKIGTGEGAQAYGHGLYFAEAPEVAKQYADNVKDMGAIKNINAELSRLADVMHADSVAGQYRQYKSDAGRQAAQRYDELMAQRSGVSNAPGNMYTVDIPDEAVAKMLDWDRPLSEQAPETVAALDKFISAYGPLYPKLEQAWKSRATSDWTGKDLYFAVGGQNKNYGTELLRDEVGIPGIRYLDGGSRSGGKGTSNYVVFDDKLPKILKRE